MKENNIKIGVFTGSFNPFTIGHYDIVRRALGVFDKIIIGVGENREKKTVVLPQERVENIRKIYKNDNRIEVKSYSGLTVDFAKENGASFIIRGIRSAADYDFESMQADINMRLGGVDTLIIFSKPELSSVSSSLVRELESFGKEISQFIPCRNK